MAYWRKFEAPSSDDYVTLLIRGRQVNVFPSPHDVPELFRTYIDPRRKRWVLEFKYIGDEPSSPWKPNEAMQFWLGRNSHRIYRIEAGTQFTNLDLDNRGRFLQQINVALNKLEGAPITMPAKANYELIRKGLLSQQDAIFANSAG